jgi:hypothetical protein
MPNPLTPLQLLVAKHYDGGQYSSKDTDSDVGDELLSCLFTSAAIASGPYDLCGIILRQIDCLQELYDALEEEPCE